MPLTEETKESLRTLASRMITASQNSSPVEGNLGTLVRKDSPEFPHPEGVAFGEVEVEGITFVYFAN